jgi:hypothetical protein
VFEAHISIYTANGVLVQGLQKTPQDNSLINLNVVNLPNGTYILQIQSNDFLERIKFIKM